MEWFIIYIIVINIISFVAMGIDKRRAVKNKWRISEKALFLFVVLGGGIGGTIGMYMFHHKTKHWYFALGFPLIAIIEYIGSIMLYFVVNGYTFG